MNIIIKPITYFYPKRNFLRTFTELLALSIKTRLLRICCGAQRCLKNWLRWVVTHYAMRGVTRFSVPSHTSTSSRVIVLRRRAVRELASVW